MTTTKFAAVIFDLGGVVFPSPFDAFDAYDATANLSPGTVRALIRTSSEAGAWAALERGELEIDAFFAALEVEAADVGFRLDARALMQSVSAGFGPRPEMVHAIECIRANGLRVGALTNNWAASDGRPSPNGIGELVLDVVVESAVEGLRKPDPRIYDLVLDRMQVRAEDCVFLDDLGINLKPARQLGMTTIKVVDPDDALAELEQILGFDIRG